MQTHITRSSLPLQTPRVFFQPGEVLGSQTCLNPLHKASNDVIEFARVFHIHVVTTPSHYVQFSIRRQMRQRYRFSLCYHRVLLSTYDQEWFFPLGYDVLQVWTSMKYTNGGDQIIRFLSIRDRGNSLNDML